MQKTIVALLVAMAATLLLVVGPAQSKGHLSGQLEIFFLVGRR